MNVTFEIAKKLKELDINIYNSNDIYIGTNNPYHNGVCNYVEGTLIQNYDDHNWFYKLDDDDYVYAPTINMVLKYFREESMYNIFATHYWYKSEMCWQYTIYDLGSPSSTIIISQTNGEYIDWEDAIMGAINKVLDELIEFKNKL